MPRFPRYASVAVATIGAIGLVAGSAAFWWVQRDDRASTGESIDGYEYLGVVDGVPVTWDACQPITWTLDGGRASDATSSTVRRAVDEMEGLSGFDFEPADSADAAGGAPPMVRIEIVAPEDSDLLPPEDWGRTDVRHVGRRATFALVALSIDGEGILDDGFGPSSWGGLTLHELGHVLGLGHVDDPSSLMHPALDVRPGRPSEVDLAGLSDLRDRSSC